MASFIKRNSIKLLSEVSFIVNYFPYMIYILLINRNGKLISNVVPLAIFYAFRRTALFIFRDLRKENNLLGWIGISFAFIGYLCGIFGSIFNLMFDVSAIFTGCAAAIFPASLNQSRRMAQIKKAGNKNNPLLGMLILFISMAIVALIAKFLPTFAFFILFLVAFIGMFAYHYVFGKPTINNQVKFNWINLLLVSILLIAMFLMEIGRNQNIGNFVEWGVFLLAVFLIVLLLILIFDKQDHFSLASKDIYFQMMMYGVCAMFWITYSAILITVVHGANAFAWIFLAYIAAIIFGKTIIKMVSRFLSFDTLTINSLMIIVGVICTFWFPTYFIGIFLIRVFANSQKQIALNEYERQSGNKQDSYFLSYYITSLSALWTQAIMWITLIIFSHFSGFKNILSAITFHQIASNYLWSINMTHIVLAIIMITAVAVTYFFSKKES